MVAGKQTEARWRALVREQEASGRSVREFSEARRSTKSKYVAEAVSEREEIVLLTADGQQLS